MASKPQGSFRLFRLWDIEVFLHWTWFLVAYWRISVGRRDYSSLVWNAAEYLLLFLIVTMHEFGHSLACRSVGGKADRIILWPLGGIAFVSPPPRPGAELWSIAAGPLVNVVLFPILLGAVMACGGLVGFGGMNFNSAPDVQKLASMIFYINGLLLVFNLLPIYPLDGGQILRALLWFVTGRARSLQIAAIIGLVGVAGLIGWAIYERSIWIGIMCLFILSNCWGGLMQAQRLARLAKAPRREGCNCPACQLPPPQGEFWTCSKCRTAFDIFGNAGTCPKCGETYTATACGECGEVNPIEKWFPRPTTPPPLPTNLTTSI